jgi:hypothetical protein
MMWVILALVVFQTFDGYYADPHISAYGTVVTDYKCNAFYLIHEHSVNELFSSAGAGRYFTVCPDGRQLGFKIIKEDGTQIPALYNLETESIAYLSEPVLRAGQPSFSDDGKIGYTIGEDLIVENGEEKEIYHLGVYANLCPISPDGNFAVYNDHSDQLWLMNLKNGERVRFTDPEKGYCCPVWAPHSRLISFSTLDGFLLVYDLLAEEIHRIGEGSSPDWSPSSEYLVYHREITDDHRLLNADLHLSRYDGSEYAELTKTSDVMEMDPIFDEEGRIIFHTYSAGEICRGEIVEGKLKRVEIIHALTKSLETRCFCPSSPYGIRDSIDVPYLNQVYDTPDWHNGHWSCAPTTAMMAIAYYRKLPYWDCWCSSPYGHTSHFGNYICSVYDYREVTYNLVAQDPSGNDAWGGYGYMWYNGYSPYSRMMNYLQYHDITSWSDDSPTWSETVAEVQAGWPYCMCVGLTAAGHLILAVGQVQDWHTLIFNDPYGNKNTPNYPSYDGKYARYDWPGYNNGYENLNTVYWCRGAHGSWLPQCDTIVDDLQYQYTGEPYGFYIFNTPPSTQRFFHDNLTGYGGHMWWTYATASADTCYVTWTPQLSEVGEYEVFAYIPAVDATANGRYQIHYDGGTQTAVVNQSNYANEWVSLGVYPFALSGGYVYLGDATGTYGEHVGFDAMRWSLVNQVAEEVGKGKREQIALSSTLVAKEMVLCVSHRDTEEMNIFVFDISGRAVFSERRVLHSSDQHCTINVSKLSAGIYFIKVSLGLHQYTGKFIKLR